MKKEKEGVFFSVFFFFFWGGGVGGGVGKALIKKINCIIKAIQRELCSFNVT